MMQDSAAKRVFWLFIFGGLVIALFYGSFVWSLGQTIQFTSLLVPDSRVGGVIFGIFVQFAPTAFLYIASAYNPSNPQEQNQRLWWLVAFWGVSAFDGFTNLGARLDDMSMMSAPLIGFDNPEYAVYAQGLMTVMGVILDFAIVFAEELLGNFISVFFDNLAALIERVGGNPPKWLAMVSSIGRSVGGGAHNKQHSRPSNKRSKDQNRNPSSSPSPNRGGRGGAGTPSPSTPLGQGRSHNRGRGGRGSSNRMRNNVTITEMLED